MPNITPADNQSSKKSKSTKKPPKFRMPSQFSDVSDVSDVSSKGNPGSIDYVESQLLVPSKFPLEFFPDKYRRAIEEISESIGTSVEIPAAALITLIGACIGRTRGIRIKKGWIEHPNLYMAVIGNSGIGKSPSCRAIYKHVEKIENEWFDDSKELLDESKENVCFNQLIVDDATTEALSDVLEANPRGILWNRDELAGLLMDLDKYSGKAGSSMSRLMSAYDSGPWKINRKDKEKNKNISHATLSIFGTIQPRSLTEVFKTRDIEVGFLPRFLFLKVIHGKPILWTDKEISVETEDTLAKLIRTTINYDFLDELKPQIIDIAPMAKDVFIAWHDRTLLESWQDIENDFQQSIIKKLHAQCLRLALIAHCIEAAAQGESELKPISNRTMDKAIQLANYFKGQKQKTLRLITSAKVHSLSPIVIKAAQAIVELEPEIKNGMLPTVRITELVNQGLDDMFQIDSRAIGKAATTLSLKTKHMPDGNSRGIVINKEDIERLRGLLDLTSETSETSEILKI
ncbi:DUF3987 domain-containing protein [Candidatus Omnitrophota bacterium]